MKTSPEDALEMFISGAAMDGKVIAECEDFDVQIFMSGTQCTAFGPGIYPEITVIASGNEVFDDIASDEDEFVKMIDEVYEKYLTAKIIDELSGNSAAAPEESPPPPDDAERRAEEIDLRERELDCAIEDFLFIVYGEDVITDSPNAVDILEALKDAFLEKCAEVVDDNIYRPTIFENMDDGTETYEDFPYAAIT